MPKLKFPGRVRGLNPKKLINKDNFGSLQNFFITLGLIFNDLKGLLFFEKFIIENYRRPNKTEVSAQQGEYGGLLMQNP